MSTKTRWWCPFDWIRAVWHWKCDLTRDDSGRDSLGKNVLLFGMIAMTLFSIKLITYGGFNETYFLIYGLLVTGQPLTSKLIDLKKSEISK